MKLRLFANLDPWPLRLLELLKYVLRASGLLLYTAFAADLCCYGFMAKIGGMRI